MAAVSPPPPPPLMESNHESSCSTPYISAPSSPKPITRDLYFSAPASPTCFTSIYQEFNKNPSINGVSNSMIPFGWEEKPGTPKHKLKPSQEEDEEDEDEDEFAFDFSGQLEKSSALSAADELFHGGKIRPLKPPPGIKFCLVDDDRKSLVSPPRSPISQGKKIIRDVFSPRKRTRDVDPFCVAMEESRKQQEEEHDGSQRGRDEKRTAGSPHRWTRSLSPFRVSDQFDEEQKQPKTPTNSSKWYSFGGYKKWKLRDLLLFRSASEGRANDKDTIRIFAVLSKKEDVKSSSFRSTDSTGSASSSTRRRGGRHAVSAHELHYTMNRANSEELKRKTVLPYRQGFFGCLRFNPTANGIAKGFNL